MQINDIIFISYAAYNIAPPADIMILEAQLILLVVTIQICPLASILLIIMLLLLNAAKTFCPFPPIGHSVCVTL